MVYVENLKLVYLENLKVVMVYVENLKLVKLLRQVRLGSDTVVELEGVLFILRQTSLVATNLGLLSPFIFSVSAIPCLEMK